MKGKSILVVDDDPGLTRLIKLVLAPSGFDVQVAHNGKSALAAIGVRVPDLIILDLMLPDMSGIEVCRQVRGQHWVPILVLTSVPTIGTEARVLDVGADSFLSKPFHSNELLAHIHRLLQDSRAESGWLGAEIAIGDLQIDLARQDVKLSGHRVQLTATEYKLLCQLATFPGQTQTHRMLLQSVWGPNYTQEIEYLHVYVSRLRRKIEPDPRNPSYVVTVPGVGYMMRNA
jgi:two-component system, OmpR family, KDP operon response regulator KdpE